MSHADLSARITLENDLSAELRRAGATLRRWMSEEDTEGPAAFAPNAIVRFGPELAEDFETTPADEARPELIEAARTINRFEGEHQDDGERSAGMEPPPVNKAQTKTGGEGQ